MTADGRDGAGNRRSAFGLSRRRLLAGLGGIGAIGAASGAGTSAYFTDAASFAGNDIGSGEVEIDIACESRRNCTVEDGHVTFAFDRIDRGDGGEQRFHVGVQTNPARLWLGTDCPPAFDPLGDAIDASLSARIGSSETTLSSGTLAGIRRDLVSGIRLDDLDGDVCLDPNGDPIELVLDWSLPDDAPGRAAGQSTSFGFQLYTEQCRHVSEDDAEGSNPFAGADDCPDPCVICADDNGVKIGTLTLRYLGEETAHVVVTGKGGSWATSGTVVFDDSIDGDETFDVDAAEFGEERLPRNLYLDDEPDENAGSEGPGNSGNAGGNKPGGVKIHTSCSESLEPGMEFGNFEVVSATTVDGELLCDDADDPEEPPEEPEEPEDPAGCVVCEDGAADLETLTFRYEGTESATLEITSLKGNTDGVLFAGGVSNGDEFAVHADDVSRNGRPTGKLGPEIRIDRDDGEEQTDVHVSCSKPLFVGDAFGDDEKYVIVDGITTDDEPLCGSEDLQ